MAPPTSNDYMTNLIKKTTLALATAAAINVSCAFLLMLSAGLPVISLSIMGAWLIYPPLIAAVVLAQARHGAIVGGVLGGLVAIACGWANPFGFYGLPSYGELPLGVSIAIPVIATAIGLVSGFLVLEVAKALIRQRPEGTDRRVPIGVSTGVRTFAAPSIATALVVCVLGRIHVSTARGWRVDESLLNPFRPVPWLVVWVGAALIIVLLGAATGAVVGVALEKARPRTTE